jgi:cytochrome c-type biogenesis protein CcmH
MTAPAHRAARMPAAGRRAARAGAPALLALGLLLLLALLAPGAATAAEPRASLPDIEDEVMCVQCGTALNISEAPIADREREFIRRRIAAGDTKEEIKEALVAEYGRAVLATPGRDGFTLAVWIVPPLLALLGLAGVLVAARRWRGREQAAPREDADPVLDPADARRLDRELAAFDS